MDFSRYKTVEDIVSDIKKVKIQGATNVALATFEGLRLYLNSYPSNADYENFINDIEKTGELLSKARPNEPLARNGVKFLLNMLKIRYPEIDTFEEARNKIEELADEYLGLIKASKDNIVRNSSEVLTPEIDQILTHCHSSTVERLIMSHKHTVDRLQVVCTETRPLFQGRITAKNLLGEGVDTTLITDGAAASYITGKGSTDIDIVFIGCDQISMKGDCINKIGSWSIALASYYASKPLYVVTSILKTDISTAYKKVEIEMRPGEEIWEEAPKGLKLINPAFELVNRELITGFITEIGVLKPSDIERAIQK
ncbi:translation initiation factor eIF-2B, partial [Candidatus Dojkabacteria bacterium]|nr:translation initiation factor eIF-2B [Candidatus Dojkabacteria bacterium]